MSELRARNRITRRTLAIVVAGALLLTGATAAVAGTGVPLLESPNADGFAVDDASHALDRGTLSTLEPDDAANRSEAARNDEPPIEDEYVEPAPEPGDPYFEAEASDGRWVSYVNPRDEYRSPYLGDGSGKICVTLLNEEGEVVVGETVPDTTVTIPTGDSIEWHSHAGPMTVDLPLTDHYERPLDADQFGTSDDVAQGDGYMDAHCIEIHGLPEDGGTVEYGEARVDGAYADWIDVVGYVQKAHDTWETDVDPIEDAVPYEEAGGWTYHPGGSHGQVVVVLQLDPPEDAYGSSDSSSNSNSNSSDGETSGEDETRGDGEPAENASDESANETETKSTTDTAGEDGDEDENGSDGPETERDGDDGDEEETGDDPGAVSDDEPLTGFGVGVALVAVALVAVARRARTRR